MNLGFNVYTVNQDWEQKRIKNICIWQAILYRGPYLKCF